MEHLWGPGIADMPGDPVLEPRFDSDFASARAGVEHRVHVLSVHAGENR